MKQVVGSVFSKLESKDVITVVGLLCVTFLGSLELVCHNGYDLEAGRNGLSCKKH